MVESSVNYVHAIDERLYYYLHEPPAGVTWRNSAGDRRTVPIHDARELAPAPTLDDAGFTLVRHETRVTDLYDEAAVRRVYYPEMEALVGDVTGATKVVAFDHNLRCTEKEAAPSTVAQTPVRLVHNDYTDASGPQRVRDLLPPAEAELRLRNRFAIVNVWKPIRGPVAVAPLAVCDARSLQTADFLLTDLRYSDRTGEIYSFAFNSTHRWFYYPRMRADEAMLLKCFDSATDCARYTAHTAFDDPGSPPDAPARESVEVRTLVFFEGSGGV